MNLSRQTCQPGDRIFLWDFNGKLMAGINGTAPAPGTYTLHSAAGDVQLGSWNPSRRWMYDDGMYLQGLIIPHDCPRSFYDLRMGGTSLGLNINVMAGSYSPKVISVPVPLGCADIAPLVQPIVDQGNIALLPVGTFRSTQIKFTKGGAGIVGQGQDATQVIRIPEPGSPFGEWIFGDGATLTVLSDMTYSARLCPGAALAGNVLISMDVLRMRLVDASGPMSGSMGGLMVNDLDVIRGALCPDEGTCYVNVRVNGPAANGSNEAIAYRTCCLVNWTFRETQRGLVCRQLDQSYAGNFDYFDVLEGNNAGELLLLEDAAGNPQQQNLFCQHYSRGCRGSAAVLCYNTKNNKYRDFDQDGGEGLTLMGVQQTSSGGNATQTGNLFWRWQLKNTRGVNESKTAGNTFENFAIISPSNTQGAQQGYSPDQIDNIKVAMRNSSGGNIYSNDVRLIDALPGWTLN